MQHGVVQGKCCQTQLLTAIEDCTKWMEEKKPFDCMYLDYRTAFDSVTDIRLLRKVKNCGITGQVQRWIKAFLHGRRQRVRVGEAISGWKKSDISDLAMFSVRAHPVCAVHQRSTPGSRISSCSFRGRYKCV